MVPSGGPRAPLTAEVKVALSTILASLTQHTFDKKDDHNNTE